jgi:hypothetical protein
VRERLEIRDVRESFCNLTCRYLMVVDLVAEPLGEREREALGGGRRVYWEGWRDIRDLVGKVKEG